MATLLLTAVGTLVGGPVGGAIGALAGRSIDGAIAGGGRREGPRLKELSVTTSSYGAPIARHHGRMRAAGTIVWATDLVEHKDKQSGKKGQPSVTTYSYTTSFAVALSSRPIVGVGRIWADGNLLRGEAGDLKVAGALRVHTGHGDQAPDPLIAADKGAVCPAFRDCAYVVFEDLALEDFGNRIPALTFEVIADEGAVTLAALVEPLGADIAANDTLGALAGFANEGGPLASTLATIDALFPLACDAGGMRLTIDPLRAAPAEPPLLPPSACGWEEDDTAAPVGADDGARDARDDALGERPDALRYYDVARDYQPGVQRPAGRPAPGRTATIEFPGALAADDARALADDAARRASWKRDRLSWRLAALDPSLVPGSDVCVPGRSGVWRVESWEWRSRGVELELVRRNPAAIAPAAGDAGSIAPPPDFQPSPTVLAVFEIPPPDTDPAAPTLFAAASGSGAAWNGAALFLDRAGELIPIGRTGRTGATIGALAMPLSASVAQIFEPDATVDVELAGPVAGFAESTLAGLALGGNRLLVGGEVIQFALAQPVSDMRWRLTGLLRGRAGTESAALAGHAACETVVLLDEAIVALDRAVVPDDAATVVAAIGPGDAEPVYAPLANAGLGRRPPPPVHPRAETGADGSLVLGWTRRARGGWTWPDEVDAPLVEESEVYRVGFGPVAAPLTEWTTGSPEFSLRAGEIEQLSAQNPGAALWVRQVGRFAQSEPLLLAKF